MREFTGAELAPIQTAGALPSSTKPSERQWWFDARGLAPDDVAVLNAAYQSGCAAIVLRPDQQDHILTA
jgi:hypothetical protein